jgi:hypothetical protein
MTGDHGCGYTKKPLQHCSGFCGSGDDGKCDLCHSWSVGWREMGSIQTAFSRPVPLCELVVFVGHCRVQPHAHVGWAGTFGAADEA